MTGRFRMRLLVLIVLTLLLLVVGLGRTSSSPGHEAWPLQDAWKRLKASEEPSSRGALLQLKGRLSAPFVLNIRSSGHDILLHMDVRQGEHQVVFNSFLNTQWSAEVERPLWLGGDFSLTLTLLDHFKMQVGLRSQTEQLDDWLTFELPVASAVNFSAMEQLQLSCRGGPNCLSITALEIAGLATTVTGFRPDQLDPRTRGIPHGKRLNQERKIRMFVGVMSAPGYRARRMGVRRSWFKEPAILEGSVVPLFILGQSEDKKEQMQLAAEQAEFGDMLIMDFIDGYYEITKKTKKILELGVLNTTADHILKCDDDSYIFLERLLAELDLHIDTYLYMGHITTRQPKTDKIVKPPFAHGPGYIVSRPLAEKCLEMWSDPVESGHLLLGPKEDVSMAIWVDHLSKEHGVPVHYQHDDRFVNGGCQENSFVGHYISPEKMTCIWGRLSKNPKGPVCCSHIKRAPGIKHE